MKASFQGYELTDLSSRSVIVARPDGSSRLVINASLAKNTPSEILIAAEQPPAGDYVAAMERR